MVPTTMSIASAAPAARESRAPRCRWCASTRRRCCARSSGCSAGRSRPSSSPASSRTATSGRADPTSFRPAAGAAALRRAHPATAAASASALAGAAGARRGAGLLQPLSGRTAPRRREVTGRRPQMRGGLLQAQMSRLHPHRVCLGVPESTFSGAPSVRGGLRRRLGPVALLDRLRR